MGLFLDSASLADAQQAQAMGFIAGITTNPQLMARTGRPALDSLKDLSAAFTKGPVFYQVTADSTEARMTEARRAYAVSPGRIVIKVPATIENFPVVAHLVSEGIDCLVTAVFSVAQAYMAAQAGAGYVAPYVNQLASQTPDCFATVRDMASMLAGTRTTLLAASLKSVEEVVATLLAGAHHVTIPMALITAMGEHERSRRAIEHFAAYASPQQ